MTPGPLTPTPLQVGVLPSIANFNGSFGKTGNTAASSVSSVSTLSSKHVAKNSESKKKINVPYLFGVTGASLEVTAGLFYIGSYLASKKNWTKNMPLEKVVKPLNNMAESVKGRINSKKFKKRIEEWQKKDAVKKIADATLAGASLVALPTEVSAAIKSQQPGMFMSSALWATAIPSIFVDLNTRTKGLYSLAYAPSFASFANEINNDFRLDEGDTPRKQKINLKNPVETLKFAIEDQIIAAKTVGKTIKNTYVKGKAYLLGKSDEKPDIFSTKPSKESMSLASTLVILGSLPKIIMGKAIDPVMGMRNGKRAVIKRNPVGIASDLVIGSGMIFDSLGMMSLANSKKDSRRTALLLGGPMRIVGDFGQQHDFFYGMRTIGGASCMYYWAGINKEKD